MSSHLTTTSSAFNAGNIRNIGSFLEKTLLTFVTIMVLILLLTNSYLRLESQYNDALILNQYLLGSLFIAIFIMFAMRFFNTTKYEKQYPSTFFIILIILFATMIIAVTTISEPFHNPRFGSNVTLVVLMLVTLIIIAAGVIPFTILYNKELNQIHNISISFVLIPASMMILGLLILDNLPALVLLYEFDIHLFSHQLRLAALLTFVGMIAGSLIMFVYAQLIKRVMIMNQILPILSLLFLIVMISYGVIKAREIYLLFAVSFW